MPGSVSIASLSCECKYSNLSLLIVLQPCSFYQLASCLYVMHMLCNHRSLLSFVSPLFRSWHQIYSATQPTSPFRSISLHAVEAEQGAASHKKGGSSLGMCSEVTASRGRSIRTSLLRHSQGVGTTCRAKTSLLPKCDRKQFSSHTFKFLHLQYRHTIIHSNQQL